MKNIKIILIKNNIKKTKYFLIEKKLRNNQIKKNYKNPCEK